MLIKTYVDFLNEVLTPGQEKTVDDVSSKLPSSGLYRQIDPSYYDKGQTSMLGQKGFEPEVDDEVEFIKHWNNYSVADIISKGYISQDIVDGIWKEIIKINDNINKDEKQNPKINTKVQSAIKKIWKIVKNYIAPDLVNQKGIESNIPGKNKRIACFRLVIEDLWSWSDFMEIEVKYRRSLLDRKN